METFSIKLTQMNNAGKETFSAAMNNVKMQDESFFLSHVANFCKDFKKLVDTKQKLGVKGLNQVRIKKSQPIQMTISFDGENFVLSYANFGQLLESISVKNLTKILQLDFNFAYTYNV